MGKPNPRYKQALSTLSDTLGASHPYTLLVQKNYIGVLILLHKERQALAQLKTMETHLASRAALHNLYLAQRPGALAVVAVRINVSRPGLYLCPAFHPC